MAETLSQAGRLHRETESVMDELGRVWIVETGEYEDRFILAVAQSLDSAVKWLKQTHDPDATDWGEIIKSDEERYHLKHYDMTSYELIKVQKFTEADVQS